MSNRIKNNLKNLVGQTLNQYYSKVKPTISDLRYKQEYQNRIIECMVGEVDDNYITTPETDNPIVKLEHSKEGVIKIPQIKGKTILIDADGNERLSAINKLKEDVNTQGLANIWKGKKIGVLGTSVAHGSNATKCYASECAKILGYNLKMFAAPGLAIHTKADGTALDYGSFTMTKEEYRNCDYVHIPGSVENFVPGQGYNDHYRTYENVFIEENKDIDLWIYAVSPNNINFNTTDWDEFDRVNWRYKDGSSLADHRKTFLGALIFIMDKMYKLNPNARMILLLDSNFAYNDGLKCFNLVKNSYHIPIIDLWGNITTTPQSLRVLKSLDGTDNHPSTFAHEIMGRMLSGELLRIS